MLLSAALRVERYRKMGQVTSVPKAILLVLAAHASQVQHTASNSAPGMEMIAGTNRVETRLFGKYCVLRSSTGEYGSVPAFQPVT